MQIRSWIDEWQQDVRYAVRGLRQNAALTVVALTLLALGIGANTAIFSVVSAVLLRPLPFDDPNRLVLLWDDFSGRGGPDRVESSPSDYVAWKQQSRSFSDMVAFIPETYNITGSGDPDKLTGIRTTANLFTVLGTRALLGRTLLPSDELSDTSPVVVISDRFWRSRFGSDPGIVGRKVALNGLTRTIVGVVPADFLFPSKEAVLWVPAAFTAEELASRTAYYMYVLARVRSDVGLDEARAEMATIARRLAQDNPRSNDRVGITVSQLHEHITRNARPAMSMLLGAVGLVLLIACANLTNLLLVRGAARRKELALRQAIGADRGRVARQLFTESAVLAVLGTGLGMALAAAAFTYLSRLVPDALPGGTTPALDWRVLLFTAGTAFVVLVVIGIAPTLAGVRLDLDATLREGTGRGTTGGGRRLRNGLVVAELALTVVLLIAAGLLLRSYANVIASDPGFNPEHVLLAETVLPPSKYGQPSARAAFYDAVLDRVKALPGVSEAGYVNFPPLVFKGGRAYLSIEGQAPPPPADFDRNMAADRVAGPGYFSAMGIPLVKGRFFDSRDASNAPLVAIVNQTLVRRHWPNQDPIGRRVKIGQAGTPFPWFTVIGVVGDVHQMALDTPAEPEIYFAAGQVAIDASFFWPQHLVVRTSGDPLALSNAVRQAVWDVDPDQPVSNVRSMGQVFDAELSSRNTQLTLVGAFAALAFVMAFVGLYGVLSYTVTRRLRDIGVKIALGASRATVMGEVVTSALSMTAIGVAIGLATSVGVMRLLSAWLVNVNAVDPLTFGASALLLVVMALLAGLVPALRSAHVDPIAILRAE